jgi:hypothetical protein
MAWALFIGLLVFFIAYDIKMEMKLRSHRRTEMAQKDIIEDLHKKIQILEMKKKHGKAKEQ